MKEILKSFHSLTSYRSSMKWKYRCIQKIVITKKWDSFGVAVRVLRDIRRFLRPAAGPWAAVQAVGDACAATPDLRSGTHLWNRRCSVLPWVQFLGFRPHRNAASRTYTCTIYTFAVLLRSPAKLRALPRKGSALHNKLFWTVFPPSVLLPPFADGYFTNWAWIIHCLCS